VAPERPAADAGPERLLLRFMATAGERRTDAGSATRRRILTAAIPLFARRGYAGTSMRDVAADVGIKASSIYEYFDGKEQMLHEALIEVLGQFHAFLSDGLEAEKPPAELLRALVERHVAWQIGYFEVAGAWDVLADMERISSVLSKAASDDIRRRRALHHDLVHALVAAVRPGDPAPRLKGEAILALCDRVTTWGDSQRGAADDAGAVAWSLAESIVAAPLPAAPDWSATRALDPLPNDR
jgi:AcrR family transcriptional regulator